MSENMPEFCKSGIGVVSLPCPSGNAYLKCIKKIKKENALNRQILKENYFLVSAIKQILKK